MRCRAALSRWDALPGGIVEVGCVAGRHCRGEMRRRAALWLELGVGLIGCCVAWQGLVWRSGAGPPWHGASAGGHSGPIASLDLFAAGRKRRSGRPIRQVAAARARPTTWLLLSRRSSAMPGT